MTALKIVFAGSPAAAVPSLRALAETEHELQAVVTREDSAQGRSRAMAQTPVAEAAASLGIPLIKANRLAGDATTRVTALAPDLGVIVAYGALVRDPLLSAPRLGWINLHFSLLPRWRGAAPVQRAIMAGDDVTGATVFQLVPELDAGAIFGRMTASIGRHQTAGNLLESLAESGAQLLVRVVDALADGTARPEEQLGEPTTAAKLTVADGEIDWTRSAEQIFDQIRGVTPEPGASTHIDGVRLKVLDATIARGVMPLPPAVLALVGSAVLVGTATQPIQLMSVHPAGRRAMDAASWWRGRPAAASGSAR